ncbi:hypothetical protein ACLB9X_17665 [Streptomyces sp. 5K101]|uniref:hypothetical protein n=1 Tax=Streptomyces sp. 5K101 TaxID=3390037 RepID=UPI0039760775
MRLRNALALTAATAALTAVPSATALAASAAHRAAEAAPAEALTTVSATGAGVHATVSAPALGSAGHAAGIASAAESRRAAEAARRAPATLSPAALRAAAGSGAAGAPAQAGAGAGPAGGPPGAPRVGDDRAGELPADQQPTCGNAADPDFPIRTRIHGGPRTVHPGGGFQNVALDLTNTTRELCHRIHPVVVLTGRGPGLTADKVDVQFRDEDAGRWRPVTLEGTSEDEIVGAFDDGFRGFVVPAGKTVTVKVRLALAAGTAPNTVTVNAAVVQRTGGDGDWVGASGDYRFDVTEAPEGPVLARPPDNLAATGYGTAVRVAVAGSVIAIGTGLVVLVSRRCGARRR